jgi:hypothetical protein
VPVNDTADIDNGDEDDDDDGDHSDDGDQRATCSLEPFTTTRSDPYPQVSKLLSHVVWPYLKTYECLHLSF